MSTHIPGISAQIISAKIGSIDTLHSKTITMSNEPVKDIDVANKQYVDNNSGSGGAAEMLSPISYNTSSTFETSDPLDSTRIIMDRTDSTFHTAAIPKAGLLTIGLNTSFETGVDTTSGSTQVGVKLELDIYKYTAPVTYTQVPLLNNFILSEGEESGFAPDLHSGSLTKFINVNKDEIIAFEVKVTFINPNETGKIYFGTAGNSNTVSKFIDLQLAVI